MNQLRIGIIGAGNVNFGGGEGPWDHASRLEQIDGVDIVGVADPDVERARSAVGARKSVAFANTRCYAGHRPMLDDLQPDAVWIGVPPNVHGTAQEGRQIEMDCAAAGIHMFIEKPLSSARPMEVRPVAEVIAEAGIITSVGYMFRYSKAVETMQTILSDTVGGAKAFLATYNCAYSEIRKPEWWDVRQSGGPIIEQATHFVDLARYLMGEVETSSLKTIRIKAADPIGALCDVPTASDGKRFDEGIPPESLAPRVTTAIWEFEGGAVGTLTHATLLHGRRYETAIEIWGDGLRMALIDPYGECSLEVRQPHSEDTERLTFDDDPYLAEDQAFIDAIRSRSSKGIRSTYEDAMRTFELTWAITTAG